MLNIIYSCHKNETSDEVKARIEAHKNIIKQKKLTKAEKERKETVT